jgi:uncharacterized lipoprotein YbaY
LGSLKRIFRRSIKLKNLFVVLTMSVFLIACGEQKAEDQQADIKIEQQEVETGTPAVVAPELVEADNSQAKSSATISGKITYDDQVALPENARLVVYLVDISEPANAVTPLFSESYILNGPPPYPYELNYDKSLVNEKGRYVLRAVVKRGKAPLFRGAGKLSLYPVADVTLSLNLVAVKEE